MNSLKTKEIKLRACELHSITHWCGNVQWLYESCSYVVCLIGILVSLSSSGLLVLALFFITWLPPSSCDLLCRPCSAFQLVWCWNGCVCGVLTFPCMDVFLCIQPHERSWNQFAWPCHEYVMFLTNVSRHHLPQFLTSMWVYQMRLIFSDRLYVPPMLMQAVSERSLKF